MNVPNTCETTSLEKFIEKPRVLPIFDLISFSNVPHISQTFGYYFTLFSVGLLTPSSRATSRRVSRNLTSRKHSELTRLQFTSRNGFWSSLIRTSAPSGDSAPSLNLKVVDKVRGSAKVSFHCRDLRVRPRDELQSNFIPCRLNCRVFLRCSRASRHVFRVSQPQFPGIDPQQSPW